MNRLSRKVSWITALPVAMLLVVLWSLPFVVQMLPRFRRLSQNPSPSPTEMRPSGSTLLLNESAACRVQPQDSAATIARVPAGTKLAIIAQYHWWYLVQVQLSSSQYVRCWINPGASTVEGPVASIPVVSDPQDVPLFATDTPGVPITAGDATIISAAAMPATPVVTPATATTTVIVGVLVSPLTAAPGTTVPPVMIVPVDPTIYVIVPPTEPIMLTLPSGWILPTKTPFPEIQPSKTPTTVILIHPSLPPLQQTNTPVPTIPPTMPILIHPTLPPLQATSTPVPVIEPTQPPTIAPTAPIFIHPTFPPLPTPIPTQ